MRHKVVRHRLFKKNNIVAAAAEALADPAHSCHM